VVGKAQKIKHKSEEETLREDGEVDAEERERKPSLLAPSRPASLPLLKRHRPSGPLSTTTVPLRSRRPQQAQGRTKSTRSSLDGTIDKHRIPWYPEVMPVPA
jgi:hypothetical protein